LNLFRRLRERARATHLPDGTHLYLRPLKEADLAHAQEFFARLSEDSKYMRFMALTPNLTEETLARMVAALHEARAAVIVAVVEHGTHEELIGGGRVVPAAPRGTCEFALTVVDAWQGRGLGTLLLRELVKVARGLGYRRIEGNVLTINARMLAVAQRLRFKLTVRRDDPGVICVYRTLRP
jgi:acetyltransferase